MSLVEKYEGKCKDLNDECDKIIKINQDLEKSHNDECSRLKKLFEDAEATNRD